jgi:hypothetical protein
MDPFDMIAQIAANLDHLTFWGPRIPTTITV